MLQPTHLTYLNNSYQFESNAFVTEVKLNDFGQSVVLLDSTIMYPQGGGQPFDQGKISQGKVLFEVSEVRLNNHVVNHIGRFVSVETDFSFENKVCIHIDESRRRLHARLHTAGHLVDDAVVKLGYQLKPIKGYHFPDGPYVEYQGILNGDPTRIALDIESRLREIIATNYQPHQEIVQSTHDLEGKVIYLPDFLPEGKPIGIVYVSSPTRGQCCGGTHVKYLQEIGSISIPKIKSKGGNTRISYQVK